MTPVLSASSHRTDGSGGLEEARCLLQVILLPERQAVELLQGHAENLLEVSGRQVSLKGQTERCRRPERHPETTEQRDVGQRRRPSPLGDDSETSRPRVSMHQPGPQKQTGSLSRKVRRVRGQWGQEGLGQRVRKVKSQEVQGLSSGADTGRTGLLQTTFHRCRIRVSQHKSLLGQCGRSQGTPSISAKLLPPHELGLSRVGPETLGALLHQC